MCTNVADKLASIISSDDGGSMFVCTTSVHFYHTKKYHNQNSAGSRHTAYQNTVLLPQNFTIQHQSSELIGTEEVQLIKLFE
jgi:hypothetical protein